MENHKKPQNPYQFREASDSEDAVIQQFLAAIMDLPIRNNKWDYLFKKTAPVIVAAVFIICLSVGFTKGFTPGLLILPFMLAAMYGVQMVKIARQKWDSSGIQYNYHKLGGHFLISPAVLSSKKTEAGRLGYKRYLLDAKIPGGQVFTEIPAIKSHFEAIQPGAHFYLIAAGPEDNRKLFAMLQSLFPSDSQFKRSDAAVPFKSLRRMNIEDRDQVLSMHRERIRIRNRLYLRNQLIIIALAAAFFIYQIVTNNSNGITLGLFMLLACSLMFLSGALQDRGVKKALDHYETIFCAEATVYVTGSGSDSSVTFKDHKNQVLFTSTLKDDIHWFRSGEKALLVYFESHKPTAYKINHT